jgi:polyphosphate kinase
VAKYQIIERDTSWLYFNHRVLQEAADPRVPLFERVKFLAIYSANLDEFFRVRVASLRSFRKLSKTDRREYFDFRPKKELKIVRNMVREQQAEFGRIFREEILVQLAAEGVFLIHGREMDDTQRAFGRAYFDREIAPHLQVLELHESGEVPFLKNRGLYLVVPRSAADQPDLIVNVPTDQIGRFLRLPPAQDRAGHFVIFIDSLIRDNLERWLQRPVHGAFSIKLSRDAELYIDNEFDGDLMQKIKASLAERDKGLPTRFLYDSAMPPDLLKRIKKRFELSKYDMIPGAKYHNFNDFFGFPLPENRPGLVYPPMPPLPHPVLEYTVNLLAAIERGDQLLSFPYQSYEYVPRLIREAAQTDHIQSIQVTLYRVADRSAVVDALLFALAQGKHVSVFVEAKARFDEASNLYWGEQLEKAGARVRYSYPAVKVHSKLLLISGTDNAGKLFHYCYIGTGNFNEKTAKLYSDHALLTADPRITYDVVKIFELLQGNVLLPNPRHLLVSPFNLERRFREMVEREIEHARAGRNAFLFLKMNSLEEQGMIDLLVRAADAGVEIKLIIRGICRLVPADDHPRIKIISIIDRFLEHARVYIMGNGGDEEIYIGSADWMSRNLFRRVEVITPIYDPVLRLELRRIMDMQWRDNSRARVIDDRFDNRYRQLPDTPPDHWRAQTDTYAYYRKLLKERKRKIQAN